jgi:Na+-transporting NADH:ubiquinone oxidoreductase subunit NqrF
MIRDITARGGTSRLHLVYGSRDRSDIIFREELDELARAHDTIEIAHVISEPDPGWDGRTGFITGDLIAELAGPHLHRITYYLCGPPAMYDFCLDALQRLDIARRRVRYEANGPPAEPGRLRGWPGQLDPATTVVVNVDGRGKFEAACGEPLLNSLERAGYQLEAGCRSGHCSLCRVKILSGAVVSGPEARIRRSDEWTGHTHACTAFPVSDVEVQL